MILISIVNRKQHRVLQALNEFGQDSRLKSHKLTKSSLVRQKLDIDSQKNNPVTQIVYVKCTDAVILASDRKESDTSDAGQDAQKYYMPTNKEYVLAMAGDSTRIGMIFGELQRSHYKAATIRDELHKIIDETKVNDPDSMPSGLLLVRNGNNITFNNVWCSDHTKNIVEGNPPFKHYGDGSYLVDYLIRKFDLPNLSWRESCPYLIAIMDAVADRVDSVGSVRDTISKMILPLPAMPKRTA